MRLVLAVLTTAVPIPHDALLAIDRQMTGRNYLPTRVVGFTYSGWSHKNGVLRVAVEAGEKKPEVGLEPTTQDLQNPCSTS